MRRFSDGAASIQAFKAHLEKMGNNSSIKQLQQVMLETAGSSGEAWVAESSMGNRPVLQEDTGVKLSAPSQQHCSFRGAKADSPLHAFLPSAYVQLSPGRD